jgi:hypothetical protein
MESKKQIYDLLPREYYPATVFFRPGTSIEQVVEEIKKKRLKFPLIGKPDIGMQGKSVKKLHNENELREYAMFSKVDFLVQEFISYENEVGIFYYRIPGHDKGRISGIVNKEFLTVEGDGKLTIAELLTRDKRSILQIPALRKSHEHELTTILKKNEKRVLVPYGNHVRGAKFIDASELISEELTNTINRICKQVNGFYFGRLDVRFNTVEELKAGKNISIIELNGAGSEPTHMYDPGHSLFFAWKEIIRHWNILWKISRVNHRRKQLPYMKVTAGLEMFRQNKRYVRMISEEFRKTA